MWECYYCKYPLTLEVQKKNRLCPNCGSDIHCCKNCVHHDESLSSKCREPNSPWIRDHASQNHCPYFEHGMNASLRQNPDKNSEAEKAKEAFRALFK